MTDLEVLMDEIENPKPLPEEPTVLPTGKPHISYSELSNWMECPFRHKLLYVDKLGVDAVSVHLDFGTALHASCEEYVKTREMNADTAKSIITEAWNKHKFSELDLWLGRADGILADVPDFLDKEFPGWEPYEVGAEELLYESIEEHDVSFKGFIDAVLTAPGPRGKKLYWLLDWKTCGWGWRRDQKESFQKRLQLILYKNFWAKKHGIPMKDVRCGFVLLKRDGKNGARCELVTVSVGDKTSARGLKVVNNMITSVKKGTYLKNRSSCKYCEFYMTPDCP